MSESASTDSDGGGSSGRLLEHNAGMGALLDDAEDESAAADMSTRSRSLTSRRAGFFLVLSLLSALLFALAPLSLSLPFTVVALLAPALTSFDFRRVKGSTVSRSGVENSSRAAVPSTLASLSATPLNSTTSAAVQRGQVAVTEVNEVRPAPQWVEKASLERQRGSANGVIIAAEESLTSAACDGSLDSSQRPGELSMIRSEERLSVRKERVVTSRLVVRKVVTTEMVILSVPVRRERLEVETVYDEEPKVHDASSMDDDTATKGYVRPLPPLPTDDASNASATSSSPSSGDSYNYVGVNESGQEVIELLLCEERPRIEMDVAPVTRVYVTKVPYPSSQIVEATLRKEQLAYIAPQPPLNYRQAGVTEHTK